MIAITTMEELPNYCYECPCNNGECGRCEADKEKRSTFEYRPYWCPLKDIANGMKGGEVGMSATIYKWIIVYDDGSTEEKRGESLYDFADDLVEVPVAIIRAGWER